MQSLLLVIALLAPTPLAWSPSIRGASLRRRVVAPVVKGGESRALIIQNKGGGHGELGFHLALTLAKDKGLKVTMLHDGGPDALTGKEPWDSYGELKDAGVELKWADLSSCTTAEALEGCGAFEHVIDNWSKKAELAAPLVGLAQEWKCGSFVFVSSGGLYLGESQPMVETDVVKEKADLRGVENLLAEKKLPWTCFRPQYIYGPNANKRDSTDWFFDRIVRGRPLPIPYSGNQLLSLTNAVDAASMISSALSNPKAVNQIFNCGTDTFYAYGQVAEMVAEVVGKEADVKAYDPEKFPDLKKGAFPFRNTAFYVNVDKAKEVLGWAPKSDLATDLKMVYEQYKALGKDKKEMDFSTDDEILTKAI
eukprot:CAMPEP_0171880162 /NCGR_PEP_ID=MMETSP0992-20121227/38287_1 /TAXON_ID=483369 /ORGANISM="non described non described, Strain CCMP2098" /LENGTH=364 /DNA_ID=CAMNT_0012505869 /DNA_START=14 /DNA_END=1108 /DNA_ORIENTATION=-